MASDHVYVDRGLWGTSHARAGLDQAFAAAKAEDTLVVPKLDQRARLGPDTRAIVDRLLAREFAFSLEPVLTILLTP